MRKVSLLIAGQDRAASNGATFDRISPVTSQVVSRSAAATFEDADSSVNAAHAAFAAWAGLAPTERRRRLLKAADLLEQRTAEFVEIGTLETGAKPDWYGFKRYARGWNAARSRIHDYADHRR